MNTWSTADFYGSETTKIVRAFSSGRESVPLTPCCSRVDSILCDTIIVDT